MGFIFRLDIHLLLSTLIAKNSNKSPEKIKISPNCSILLKFQCELFYEILPKKIYFRTVSKSLGTIHKLHRQDFTNFWPPSPFRRQVYFISLCSNIGIWLTPSPSSPAYVVYGWSLRRLLLSKYRASYLVLSLLACELVCVGLFSVITKDDHAPMHCQHNTLGN